MIRRKKGILQKLIQIILTKENISDICRADKREIIYCVDDDEYRIYRDICKNLVFERYYNNRLISRTHVNNVLKRQWLNNTKYLFLLKYMYVMNVTDDYNSFSNCTGNEKEDININKKYLFHLVYFYDV